MPVLDRVEASDPLGRRVLSRDKARRAARGVTPHHVFYEPSDPDISTDRLDITSDAEMTAIADSATPSTQTFYGWAVVSVGVANGSGRRVERTPEEPEPPRLGNPYHASIYLPEEALGTETRDARKQHAHELARNSEWRACAGADRISTPSS